LWSECEILENWQIELKFPVENQLIDIVSEHATLILSVIGAVTLAFLTPFGTKIIERRFSRRPAFSVNSLTINSSLLLSVKPANRAAQKKKALGVRVRGLNIVNASKLEGSDRAVQWRVDLSKVPGIRDIFRDGQDYDFEFFFDPGNASDKVTIRYIETQSLFAGDTSEHQLDGTSITRQTVRGPSELITNVRSNVSIFCDFDEERSNISRAFPAINANVRWINVHDGKELLINDVSHLELTGTKILADPRYAWVLNFEGCHSLALRGLTVGHTKSGYCRGGVLRFENCSNVTVENCELFGSGTYGIEFLNCENIEIVGTTVKECTYGAVNITNVSNAAFRDCKFQDNTGFELFKLDGVIEAVTLQDCEFSRNQIEGAIFCFINRSGFGLFVHNSSCTESQFAEISNLGEPSRYYFDRFADNKIVPSLWASNR
jgi:parallel beta-helix repeat protein